MRAKAPGCPRTALPHLDSAVRRPAEQRPVLFHELKKRHGTSVGVQLLDNSAIYVVVHTNVSSAPVAVAVASAVAVAVSCMPARRLGGAGCAQVVTDDQAALTPVQRDGSDFTRTESGLLGVRTTGETLSGPRVDAYLAFSKVPRSKSRRIFPAAADQMATWVGVAVTIVSELVL